jgi:hypothetical protein
MSTIDRLTLAQRVALVDAIAASGCWERVAQRCNVDPAAIRASIPGGQHATDAACVRGLEQQLASDAFSTAALRSAVIDAGLRSLATDPQFGLSGESAYGDLLRL